MKDLRIFGLIVTVLVASLGWVTLGAAAEPSEPYPGWLHSGSIYILTTPEGADMPASTMVKDFPLLVRLNRDFFDFNQAGEKGADIRFATVVGVPLAYQIEEWDATNGMASIWVRIPVIAGQERQQIKMYWGNVHYGNPAAATESSGNNVFNESNGYLSVWHLNGQLRDDAGTVPVSRNDGTTATRGVIGEARHFAGGQGIYAGDDITNYPSGTGPMTTEAWFRTEKPNVNLVAWGKEQRPGKIMMKVLSPPKVGIHCYFADVDGRSPIAVNHWYQVVHTYQNKDSRVYLDGRLDGVSAPVLAIPKTSGLWMGGWHNDYDFRGDLDEVRISKVVRSADWIKLQYENQNPLQTLVGTLVPSGDDFSVSVEQAELLERQSVTFAATASGAQKVYWTIKHDGQETCVAVDQLHYVFDAGRVAQDQVYDLQFKAVYPQAVKTKLIRIHVTKDIQDPVFTLKSPSHWNGREQIQLAPQIINLPAMLAKGAGDLNYTWSIDGIAVAREIAPGKMLLKRAFKSGPLTVTLTVDNGGSPVKHAVVIQVQEPKCDPWINRLPAPDEQPVDNQFYARDNQNVGTLYYGGKLTESADKVFLKVYAGDRLYRKEEHKLSAGNSYSFSARLKPGLVKYRVEFGRITAGQETILHTATNLICGDAFLIDGQSNAEAVEFGSADYPFTSEWIRSFGSTDGDPDVARLKLWGNAVARSRHGQLQIGYWGMELARRLVADEQMPVCIINGAVGGTRIDLHQRNAADPTDVNTIYGRLLWRVQQARLTHGIRGILWHQGENDQGADGPSGDFGWKTYRDYFIAMSAAWQQDYPNLRHRYMFQIWPKSCAMGIDGSDNQLREVQRSLPIYFSNLSIMSTLGVSPSGGCHYPPLGYAGIARLIGPLIERDNYGAKFEQPVSPPNLHWAYYSGGRQDEMTLEFDQPVEWTNSLAGEFYVDGKKGLIASGETTGNYLKLKLWTAIAAKTITYLDSKSWSQTRLLWGKNGVAALTFYEVPLMANQPSR